MCSVCPDPHHAGRSVAKETTADQYLEETRCDVCSSSHMLDVERGGESHCGDLQIGSYLNSGPWGRNGTCL
ncbi:hypothetical protein ATANTOWER_011962 [Ataeniobius toweri]|uniref:Uncharacterized protein n=1 Tax=Ataeniobius toweri TaxID=208326 RepID=A0ABU7BTL9_9TELE|nr:hypothetical protein [Ataeniobius toweri]